MQQGTTILQYLSFRPSTSFHDPATPDGKLWNTALKYITQTQSWVELHWGSRVETEEVVDLLITWASNTDLLHFMTHNYQSFLTIISTLLLPGGPSISSPSPYVLQLHPGMPNLDFGTVSSVYELSFHSNVDENVKTGLFIEKQLCRSMFMEAAEEIGDGFDFLNMDATWAEPYHDIESPSPLLAASESTALAGDHDQRKQDGNPQIQTLLIMTDWARTEAEKLVSDSGVVDDHSTSAVLTAGEYFKKNMLQTAHLYKNHHAVFENVSTANVAWLDKEEKWSTYVMGLLAQEQRRSDARVTE